MIPDLAAIQARLEERQAALQSGTLSEAELHALAAESAEILRQLRALRAAISPQLSQTQALLRQLESAGGGPAQTLDCRF